MHTGNSPSPLDTGYCLCIDTICEGTVASEHDARGNTIVYPTLREAQMSLAEDIIERLTLFLENTMEFDHAIDVDDYIVEVCVGIDGLVYDAEGNSLGHRATS
ncbi:MAG TPA: hypothetical protein PKE12_03620 [Kiritimatiellia bacterium]|nr:hypothetical protein [Kiritimatiellia bacterium]